MAPGGTLDRNLIAERVFGDEDARSWLEGRLWPLVGERVALWRAAVETADPAPRAAVVEVPLLFESGMEKVFDATIAVVADESLRGERAVGPRPRRHRRARRPPALAGRESAKSGLP